MICVTRLNGSEVVLNPGLVCTIEATPDTLITFINGEKLLVAESCTEVTDAITTYFRDVGIRVIVPGKRE